MQGVLCILILTAPAGAECLSPPPVPLDGAAGAIGVPVRIIYVSYYDPWLCTLDLPALWTNCYDREQWWRMGDGGDARHWYDRAIACPNMDREQARLTGKNWYGRWLFIPGLGWRVCREGGGDIVEHDDGSIVVDVLTRRYPHDTSPRTGYWLEMRPAAAALSRARHTSAFDAPNVQWK